jgi:hypothetical protein
VEDGNDLTLFGAQLSKIESGPIEVQIIAYIALHILQSHTRIDLFANLPDVIAEPRLRTTTLFPKVLR